MAQPPAPKRRRVSGPDEADTSQPGGAKPHTLITRKADDILKATRDLHRNLDVYGDVLICACSSDGSEVELTCVSALVAASSRPLAAMLYGPMRMCTPRTGEEEGRPRLVLHTIQPSHLRHLLDFIHGQDLPLEVEEAFEMHHVADFYEVLALRDACMRCLLDALQAHNCCHLLERAQDVHCEPLVQRCVDMLTLDFIAVVEHDDSFHRLPASVLAGLCASDELVCAEEYEVLEAIAIWYERGKSAAKHAALPELLALVRWALIGEGRHADVLNLAERLVAPPADDNTMEDDDNEPDALHHRRQRPRPSEESAAGESMPADVSDAAPSSSLSPPPSSSSSSSARRAPADEPMVGDMVQRVHSLLAAAPPSAADMPRERQYRWGTLTARNSQSGETEMVHTLASTKEYMIGRSRRSDIRVGHTAQMPYISSQHCRIYHQIRWPDDQYIGGAWMGPDEDAPAEGRVPRLQAWLEDLSQNGTFINGLLVGKNKRRELMDGDRIEMVFPAGRQPQNQQNNQFPVFTYEPVQPPTPLAVLGVDQTETSDDEVHAS
jgi:hypothetical protein